MLTLPLYYSIGEGKSTMENMEKKKMGRPTDNPKSKPIHVRLDENTSTILDKYMDLYKVSRAEAIREGIQELEKYLQ